jgi:hypothetical protein
MANKAQADSITALMLEAYRDGQKAILTTIEKNRDKLDQLRGSEVREAIEHTLRTSLTELNALVERRRS